MKILNNLLILVVFAIVFVAIGGHIFNVPSMYRWGGLSEMRSFCAINFLFVAITMLGIENRAFKSCLVIGTVFSSVLLISVVAMAFMTLLLAYFPESAVLIPFGDQLPSVVTLIALILIALCSFVFLFTDHKKLMAAAFISGIMMMIGSLSVIGNLSGTPSLYFWIQNNGVSLPTGIVLLISGLYFLINISLFVKLSLNHPQINPL